jgi:hypothetical protein
MRRRIHETHCEGNFVCDMRRRIHACNMRRRIHETHCEGNFVCDMRRRIHACNMRRRIHACNMRRRIHETHCVEDFSEVPNTFFFFLTFVFIHRVDRRATFGVPSEECAD